MPIDTITTDAIIKDGKDITSHYLNSANKEFKIYRYQQNIYAVRYATGTSKPVDFVHMWRSHAGEKIASEEYLDKGTRGKIYKKTEDKAYKDVGFDNAEKKKIDNELILKQKFLLKEHNIEQYFILGLWNVKKEKVLLNMPKITQRSIESEALKRKYYEEFALALKKLNELGYAHPDLTFGAHTFIRHNTMMTEKGVRTFDLDSGFRKLLSTDDDKQLKDQWLSVYNNTCNTKDDWRNILFKWYQENKGKSLTENPEAILNFYLQGMIELPEIVVKEYEENNLRKVNKSIKDDRNKYSFYKLTEPKAEGEKKEEKNILRKDKDLNN